jgi:hypothetical protein
MATASIAISLMTGFVGTGRFSLYMFFSFKGQESPELVSL